MMNVNRIFGFLYCYYRKDLIICIIVAIIGGVAEFINLVILQHVLSSLSEIEHNIVLSENNSVHELFLTVVISTVSVLLFRLLINESK